MEASRETLAELLELQKVDSAIDLLTHRQRNLPEQVQLDSLTEDFEKVQRGIGEEQSVFDTVSGRQKSLDAEVESISSKIAGEEEKLNAGKVASPRELASLQAEVESLKRRRSAIEDSDLEVMEEKEASEKRLNELQSRAEQLKAAVAAATHARDAASKAIDDELAALRAGRALRSPRLDPELLDFYDDLRSAKSGIAVAALADGACQGCHMKLPAQEQSRLKRAEGLIRCMECSRILVVPAR